MIGEHAYETIGHEQPLTNNVILLWTMGAWSLVNYTMIMKKIETEMYENIHEHYQIEKYELKQ